MGEMVIGLMHTHRVRCRVQSLFAALMAVVVYSGCTSAGRSTDHGAPDISTAPSSTNAASRDGAAPPTDATTQSVTAFDGTAADIVQHNRPPEQAEIEPARAFDGCVDCTDDEFCDRDRCTIPGRGGVAYEGGMLGHTCHAPDSSVARLDPRLAEVCQGHLCIDGTCLSCRTDLDCCLLDSDPASCEAAGGGDLACLWWSRINSNICLSRSGLRLYGIEAPE